MGARTVHRTGARAATSPVQRFCRCRDLFEEGVVKAERSRGWAYDEAFVAQTRRELRRMGRLAASLEAIDEPLREDEVRHLQALARRRVYILPEDELEPEASAAYEEMREWGVPAMTMAVLADLRNRVVATGDRAALNRLLQEYAYWDGYIDWYNETSTKLRWTLLAGAGVLFLTALAMAQIGWVPPLGWALSGAAGAMFSVGFKVPPPTSYGEANALFNGVVFVRVVSGTVTSMVTIFLLASGVVNLSIGQAPLPEIAHRCLEYRPVVEAVEHAIEAKPIDAEQTRAAALSGDGACNPPNLSLLLCIALLLGFSERSLSGLVGQVLGAGDPGAAPAPPRATTGGEDKPEIGDGKTKGAGEHKEGEHEERGEEKDRT